MREFDVRQLTEAVSAMVQDVNYRYPADVKHCLDSACEKETSRIGKATLEYLKPVSYTHLDVYKRQSWDR